MHTLYSSIRHDTYARSWNIVVIMLACKVCGKMFATNFNLGRHMKRLHSDRDDSDGDENDRDIESKAEEESDTDDSFNGESTDTNVWKVIDAETKQTDGDLLENVKRNIKFCRSFRRDKTIQAVKETLNQAQEKYDMDFREALDYAVDKRKFLIRRTWEELNDENYEADMEETSEQ